MSPLLFALTFVAVLFLLEGIYYVVRGTDQERARQLKERLRELARRKSAESAVTTGEGTMVRSPAKYTLFDDLETLLARAGSSQSVARFLTMSAALAFIGFALLAYFAGSSLRSLPGLFVGILPVFLMRRAAAKRMQKFSEQLPEALELLTRSLRAGHALSAGFQLVGEETDDPLGTEFALVSEEIRFGLDLRDALENLTKRVDDKDLPYLTTAVLIQRQTGGNLAELLEKLGGLLRSRIQFHGRVRAMTSQGRGAANFLAFWMPAMIGILLVVSPGYLTPMFETPEGRVWLGAAAAIDVVAFLLAREIANVEV